MEKTDIALTQLRKAIQLFNKNDFICSLTLAGAAEEILGKIALKRKGYNISDLDKSFWDGFAELQNFEKVSKEKIMKVSNRLKNELKHNDIGENTWVEGDFCFSSQDKIDKAINNYLIAYDKFPKDKIINTYVNHNWGT